MNRRHRVPSAGRLGSVAAAILAAAGGLAAYACGRPEPTPLSDAQSAEISAMGATITESSIEARILSRFNSPRHFLNGEASVTDTIAYIAAELSASGYAVETQDVTLEYLYGPDPADGTYKWVRGPFTMPNVIGRKAGADPSLAPVVVCAHYDTVYGTPGANDNGAACAALLEIALAAENASFRRDMIFAFFSFEEEGLVGSTDWASSLDAADLPDCVLDMETIAFTSERENQIPLSDSLLGLPLEGDFIGAFGSSDSASLVLDFLRASDRFAPGLKVFAAAVDSNLASNPFLQDLMRSDHAPFWSLGVPALMITDTANLRDGARYHLPTDTADSLDLGFALNVARATLATACIRATLE